MAKKAEKKEKTYLNITGMTIGNVRRLSKTVIAFSLLGNGLGLYNMRIVDGRNGKFVAAPQEKGKDGEYYNVYSVYLSDDDQKRIIEAATKKLPAEDDDDIGDL